MLSCLCLLNGTVSENYLIIYNYVNLIIVWKEVKEQAVGKAVRNGDLSGPHPVPLEMIVGVSELFCFLVTFNM